MQLIKTGQSQGVLSYVLVLPFITYNAYLALVVLAGAGTGYPVLCRKNARLLNLELAEESSFSSTPLSLSAINFITWT